jgi:glycosyltransferase involved in cell wall biosynthesis
LTTLGDTWHIVTGEYPPQPGGVGDYSRLVAAGLAAAGDSVHVWCPALEGQPADEPGVHVHAIAGAWRSSDLERLDNELGAIPGRKRLLVQWVPHAYGRRSLNVGFCEWVRRRARKGDVIDLMVHEPFLAFGEGSLRQDLAAAVHRLMMALLLSHARRVWVSIPAWTDRLRPWAFGRDIAFQWLPVPSNIPMVVCDHAVSQRRAEMLRGRDGIILGHFSTYPPLIRNILRDAMPLLLAAVPGLYIRLLGRGSEPMLDQLRPALGEHESRVQATGELTASALSSHLQACDLMLQPYPDGASTRRGTLMAALAHGLPVVTTVGRLSEPVWRTSDAVVVAPAGDLPALVRDVTTLAQQPERRRQLGDAARAMYETMFSLPHVVNALRTDAA